MGRRPATPESSVEIMCRDMAREGLMPRSIEFYRQETLIVIRALRAGGRHEYPWEITEDDTRWLIQDLMDRGIAVSTRKGYISALKRWTTHFGNDTVALMRIRWPRDARPTVDWLTTEQAIDLLRHPKSPTQDIIIHCELCLGMRRIEVLRLKPSDFDGSTVSILGKGSQGGKPRRMPYHRDTGAMLSMYMAHRRDMITAARARNPLVEIPDALLIYRKGDELHPYNVRGTGIDKLMEPLKAELGFSWGNHTLRRTFGRTMYRSHVPVATISKMLGHESIEMTLRYIGVDLDDMGAAMDAFILRRDKMSKDAQLRELASKKTRPEEMSGPNVIRTHSPGASTQTPTDNSDDPHYFYTEQEAIEYAKRFNAANGADPE